MALVVKAASEVLLEEPEASAESVGPGDLAEVEQQAALETFQSWMSPIQRVLR